MRNSKSVPASYKKTLGLAVAALLVIGFFPKSANAAEAALNLGTASTYGALASSAITSATSSGITGTAGADVGVGSATAPTGPLVHAGTQFLGGPSLTALVAATAAHDDLRSGTTTGVELGGKVITPGAYTNPTFDISGVLTLDGLGDPNSIFIFRSASTLVTGSGSSVLLTNGAQACNVYWQVGSSATLGTSSTMVGHVIAKASVTTGASTSVNGQLIGLTGAVTLGGTTIVNNSCIAPVVVVATPTPTPVVVVATPTPTPVVVVATPTPTPTIEIVEETPIPVTTTEAGGELPKTSNSWGNSILLAIGLILASAIGFIYRRKFLA